MQVSDQERIIKSLLQRIDNIGRCIQQVRQNGGRQMQIAKTQKEKSSLMSRAIEELATFVDKISKYQLENSKLSEQNMRLES